MQTVLSDASIKTIDGGYEEMNKEQSGREKSGIYPFPAGTGGGDCRG